jgi:integrase
MVISLKLAQWPSADQEAWAQACRPKQGLRRGGAAAPLAAVTRKDLERRYGYFLTYLNERRALDRSATAAAQITPEAVQDYLAYVERVWSSTTVAQTLFKLVRMGKLLAPDRDWAWLTEIACDRDLVAYPKPRFDRIVTSERLVEAGLGLIRAARQNPRLRRHWRAIMIRNGLMVALLAVAPIRLKNFVDLTLGTSFKRIGDRWWFVLGRRGTKSRAPDERPVPGYLNRAIATYLTYARPILLGQREFVIGEEDVNGAARDVLTGSLWVGETGVALGYSRVERAIMAATRKIIGRTISPHDFRRNGATTARFRAGNEPHLASGLLHHRDRNVTENYNLASSFEAAQRFAELVDELRREKAPAPA